MRAFRLLRPGSLVAASALLLAPGLVLGAQLDAAVFVLAGVRIREGAMPYRGFWDHKPPGSYLLNALGQTALPWLDPWLVSWLLTLVITAATVLLVDSLLRRKLSPGPAWLWSVVCAVGIACYPVALGGGATESFALLPLVAALWMIAGGPLGLRHAAMIGCLASVACLMSLQSLPAAAVVVVAALLGGARGAGSRPAGLGRMAVAVVAGGLALPAVVLGWLFVGGALGDAVDQIVAYNGAYRSASPGLGELLPITLLFAGCLLIPVGVTVARMVRAPRSYGRIEWASLAWTIAYIAYVVYQDRIYLHYLILVVPPMVVLAGPGAQWLWTRLWSHDRRVRLPAIALSAAAAGAFLISTWVAIQLTALTVGKSDENRPPHSATVAWLDANTPASATLFVWGDDTDLYLSSGRTPYDRYVYQFPMVTAGYWSADRTADLLAAWRATPPAVIVEVSSTVPMFEPPADSPDPRSFDTLGPLRDFVRDNYRLAATAGTNNVYVLVRP